MTRPWRRKKGAAMNEASDRGRTRFVLLGVGVIIAILIVWAVIALIAQNNISATVLS
jgi:hypothetical protein